MAYDVYTTGQLIGYYSVLDRPKRFFKDTFFKNEELFDTQQVVFDKVQRARKIAPLVSPSIEGKAEKLRGYNAISLTPSYLKPKMALEPGKMQYRRQGEVLAGDLSPQERIQMAVADALRMQDDQISRFEELMCISLMTTGAMTISTPDFGTLNLDMQRPAGNTVTLSGAAAWGATGVNPLDNLIEWSALIQAASGYAPRVAVMDPKAYLLFIRSQGILEIMQSFNQQSGYVDLAGRGVGGNGNEAYSVGKVGALDIVVYQQYYEDENGNQQQFMPDNTVVMADPDNIGGSMLYGAIQDFDGYVPATRFPKMWKKEDPSAYFVMTASAPLALAGWSQASFCATVA